VGNRRRIKNRSQVSLTHQIFPFNSQDFLGIHGLELELIILTENFTAEYACSDDNDKQLFEQLGKHKLLFPL